MDVMRMDALACYRAVESRDTRFDGVFYTAVRTTGIYCRPSCPARTPKPANVTFHRTAAAAQAAGFRACKRCLPGVAPGSPEWDLAADVAGRAMRLIADGVVERSGVDGLAARMGYSPRHLTRLLTRELGAGPLALARAQRAQTARTLLESTGWRTADVAFAAGFASVRQFNDTMRTVYATTPSELRALGDARADERGAQAAPPAGSPAVGGTTLTVELAVRPPYDAAAMHAFLAAHVCAEVESVGHDTYTRSLLLPHGPAVVTLHLGGPLPSQIRTAVGATLHLSDLRDLATATERCRRLLDADSDPSPVASVLADDQLLSPSIRSRPGLRVPGAPDGDELALRTVLGQQVSLAAANRLAAHLTALAGASLPSPLVVPGVTRTFPTAAAVAAVDPSDLPVPRARARALVRLAEALDSGEVALDRSGDRSKVRAALLGLPGVGPWTADYIRMRSLGDPDVFLPDDAAARRVAGSLSPGLARRPTLAARAESWRPWRSYALMHLWADALATPALSLQQEKV
jgi:AraC family transcriptional regulator, regulatory protein of adaptative response / DNA-3-methyladenine glycosylase II